MNPGYFFGDNDDCEDDGVPPIPPHIRPWRCYRRYNGGILEADVEAVTAEDAAILAAAQQGMPGEWTVIPGHAVTVSIAVSTEYVVKRAS